MGGRGRDPAGRDVARSSLRRFTRAAAPLPAVPSFAGGRPAADRTERCEMCGAGLGGPHGHVVALDDRSLRCACRPCHLLFEAPGAGGGRFRAVPERYLTDLRHRLGDADWELLRIPVTTAFFFVNSDLDRVIACYPSPAGATECLLDLAEWGRLQRSYPLLRAPADDVEAVYVTRSGDLLEAFLVPVDACYSLVGQVRLRWRGIDGGDEVREVMAGFLADLLARSRPLG